MLNARKLKGEIIASGNSISSIAEEIGLCRATFYRKMKNNSFTIYEVDQIAKILSLGCEEATAIFFSNDVA